MIVPGAAIRSDEALVVSSRRIRLATRVYWASPGYRVAWPSDTMGNQWLTCMIPLAFESRPSSEVPMTPVARTANRSRMTAVAPMPRTLPSWSSRLELFVQRADTGRASTEKPEIDVSSPKARGVTDRLTFEIELPETLR